MKVKVAQSCPTLCDPMGYTVHGILQARILEWVAFPSPGDLPNPGIKPISPTLRAVSLPAEPQGKPQNRGSLFEKNWPRESSQERSVGNREGYGKKGGKGWYIGRGLTLGWSFTVFPISFSHLLWLFNHQITPKEYAFTLLFLNTQRGIIENSFFFNFFPIYFY